MEETIYIAVFWCGSRKAWIPLDERYFESTEDAHEEVRDDKEYSEREGTSIDTKYKILSYYKSNIEIEIPSVEEDEEKQLKEGGPKHE